MKKKNRKKLYHHDWDGECDPSKQSMLSWDQKTFSVGIFQWVQTRDGKGLKRSKVVYRVKGSTTFPGEVYQRAEVLCDRMDRGDFHSYAKQETVR